MADQMETIIDIVKAAHSARFTVLGVRVAVRFGTGETVESDLLEWVHLV